MIVKKGINPRKSLYYLGSLIINEFITKKEEELDFLELYSSLKEQEGISMDYFLFTLDWLFLSGIVEHKNKMIKKCF